MSEASGWSRIRRAAFVTVLAAALAAVGARSQDPSLSYRIERGELVMADGVALAATYFLPVEATPAGRAPRRFPVLLELLPYRKDDSFYLRDLPHHALWAHRGFASVKVDVRGTGASAGRAPDREYSDAELDDAVEIIRQLAAMPWSNGKVAMWGISWGGFNAYQVALRRPPGLFAIVAVHAADDLYRDSIDFLDGILHVDPYHLQIHHENGLPATPGYALDAAFFRDRFDVRPWIFDHLAERDDGAFWRPSIRLAEGARLELPTYAIGGLLDGYRDFPLRLLERAMAPVRVDVGPWNHSWPHDGEPGPNYEWVDEADRFLRRFLVDGETPDATERRLLLFVRAGHAPDPGLAATPGRWLETPWPVPGATRRTLYATAAGRLTAAPPRRGSRRLVPRPGAGTAAGIWWGEPTGDQRGDDAESLVFDGAPLVAPIALAGRPHVHVSVSFDGPGAADGRVVARLEDVDPEGRVALVTGAALAARHRRRADRPLAVPAGEPVALDFDLHATTWTFRPGHRVRLALSTAQFPMLWPAAGALGMTVRSGGGPRGATWLELPEMPLPTGPEPTLPPPSPRAARTDARWLECGEGPDEVKRTVHDLAAGTTRYETKTACAWEIGERRYRSTEENLWEVENAAPERARYFGRERHTIALEGGRVLALASELELTSDATSFHLRFQRALTENGAPVREREWRESYPRP